LLEKEEKFKKISEEIYHSLHDNTDIQRQLQLQKYRSKYSAIEESDEVTPSKYKESKLKHILNRNHYINSNQ